MSLEGAGSQVSNTIRGLDLAVDKGKPYKLQQLTGSAFGRTVSLSPIPGKRRSPLPPTPSSQASTPNHSKSLSEFSTTPVAKPRKFIRSMSESQLARSSPVSPNSPHPGPQGSLSSVNSSFSSSQSSLGSQSMIYESLDSVNQEQSSQEDIRESIGEQLGLAPSRKRKLKSKTYGRLKRWLKKEAWKPVSEQTLRTVGQPLRGKLEARNDKIARLAELKQDSGHWQRFEKAFGEEMKLLKADKPPKKGAFRIPGTDREVVFDSKRCVALQEQDLKNFKEAFKASPGYDKYLNAAYASENASEERATLKKQLAREEKQLAVDIEEQFRDKETRYHQQISDQSANRHEQAGQRKEALSEHFQTQLLSYQAVVSGFEKDLSVLRERRNFLRDLAIPRQKGKLESLERKHKLLESSLKSQYTALSRSERKTLSFEEFAGPQLNASTAELQVEGEKLVRLKQELNSYKDDKAALQDGLKTARKALDLVRKSTALQDSLKDIDRESRVKDREDLKAHKAVPDIVKENRRSVRHSIKGR